MVCFECLLVVTPIDVLARYEALRLWDQTLKSPDSEYWVQLGPGTAVSEFDTIKIHPS